MVSLAAKRLGCTYHTILNYCERHPTVMAAKQAERVEMIDTAELKLWQAIQSGQPWSIALVLKTLGKDRGYVERTEQTGKDGAPLVTEVHVHLSTTAQEPQHGDS